MFSYGSGLASSMFTVRFSDDASPDSSLEKLSASLMDLQARLDSRQKMEPAIFSETMKLREDTHHLGETIVPKILHSSSNVHVLQKPLTQVTKKPIFMVAATGHLI